MPRWIALYGLDGKQDTVGTENYVPYFAMLDRISSALTKCVLYKPYNTVTETTPLIGSSHPNDFQKAVILQHILPPRAPNDWSGPSMICRPFPPDSAHFPHSVFN